MKLVIFPAPFARLLGASLCSLGVFISSAIAAETPARFQSASPSRVLLSGSSNIAPWRCQGTTIFAEVQVDTTIEKIHEVIDRIEDGNLAAWMDHPEEARFPPPSFQLAVPIDSLRCGNRIMERDLEQSLKAHRHPSIEFRFVRLAGPIERDMDRNLYRAQVVGEISAAGVTRPTALAVMAQRISRDQFRLTAELSLRMTDFDITPPTALFGMIKAANELKVRFDLVLRPAYGQSLLEAQAGTPPARSGS